MQTTDSIKTIQPNKKGFSGSTLKIIAIAAMLIDHIAASVMDGYLQNHFFNWKDLALMFSTTTFDEKIIVMDTLMRLIGRVAFPLFCFLLVEGFCYTHNRIKYALRLFIFALISEIPFDLAFGLTDNWVPEFSSLNVYFTLLLGLLTIWGLERFPKWYFQVPVFITGVLISYCLHTDYQGIGVITIALMYFFRKQSNTMSMLAGCIALMLYQEIEVTSLFNVWLVSRYNGKRGLKLKYVFYLFYPVHLILLYLIRCAVLGKSFF